MHTRTVFFVSDGTGITAETFGNAILAQFELAPRRVRLPFIDTADKAHQAVRQINHTAEVEGRKSIVFTTLVNMEVLKVIQEGCKGGMLLDMFGTFVHPLEVELGIKSLYYLRSKSIQRAGFAGGVEADNTADAPKIELSAGEQTDYEECLACQ